MSFTMYEWDVEEIDFEYEYDVLEHDFRDRLNDYHYYSNDNLLSEKYDLCLVRSTFEDGAGLVRREYAYFDKTSKSLPLIMDCGTTVPKRYQAEFKRWSNKRWGNEDQNL